MLVFGEKGKPEFRGGAGLLEQTERANKINSRLASSKDSILDPIGGIFIITVIIMLWTLLQSQVQTNYHFQPTINGWNSDGVIYSFSQTNEKQK